MWTYEHPLTDAADVIGRLAFFDERVDVVIDGVPQGRPDTEFTNVGWQDGAKRSTGGVGAHAETPGGPLYKRHISPDREPAALVASNRRD